MLPFGTTYTATIQVTGEPSIPHVLLFLAQNGVGLFDSFMFLSFYINFGYISVYHRLNDIDNETKALAKNGHFHPCGILFCYAVAYPELDFGGGGI